VKKYIFLAITLLFISANGLFANGLSLNSIGPRALGMGGAMVGLADDYTALYWNPAGLSNTKGSFLGVYFTGISPMGTYELSAAGIDTETESNIYPTGGLIGIFPISKDLTFAFGVYVPAGLGAQWNGTDLAMLSGGTALDWESKIGLINISPAVSYKVTDQLSLGLAVNVYYALFNLDRPASTPGGFMQYSEESTGLAYGVTLGAQYAVNDMITVGATFRTKADVTMDGEAENPFFGLVPPAQGGPYPTKSDFEREVSWPLWFGAGIAVKPMENLTLALDIQYSQWSESEKEFDTKYKDNAWDTFISDDDKKFTLLWNDATQIRFGAEYKLSEGATIRAGFYTDPAPAPDKTYNIIFPSIDYTAITGGASVDVGGVVIDFAAEYLFGSKRDIAIGKYADAMPGLHNMDIFAFSIGTGFSLD